MLNRLWFTPFKNIVKKCSVKPQADYRICRTEVTFVCVKLTTIISAVNFNRLDKLLPFSCRSLITFDMVADCHLGTVVVVIVW